MAIDARIPLGVTAPQIDSPQKVAGTLALLANQQGEAQERQIRLQQIQRQQAGQDAVRAALKDSNGDLRLAGQKVMAIDPEMGAQLLQHADAADRAKSEMENIKIQHDLAVVNFSGQTIGAVLAAPEDQKQQAWEGFLAQQQHAGLSIDGLPQQYNAGIAQRFNDQALTAQQRLQERDRQITEQRQAAAAAVEAANKKADNDRADAALKETQRHNQKMEARPVAGSAGGGGSNDVKDAVAGMKAGTLPPQLPGRASKEYVAIMAEAKRQGYDLATAATDWSATQKHIATLNGAQQTRIRQAVDNAAHSLDVIDDLAGQWKAGRFPLLNKGQLAAAKSGVFGPKAQAIATQLDAQIADVTSELANVYMGGNSPTDHALDLAAKNLNANWSQDTLQTLTKQARANLQIRTNSINNVGVAGASQNNPYAPPAPAAAPAQTPNKVGRFEIVGVK